MELEHILRLMQNAGFRILGADANFIYIEDPACVLRAFETFAEYAWIALICATGLLLFGWAISMIRGAKNDIFTNLRNLILIFGIVSAAGPIINLIYGDNLFARACKTEQISVTAVQELLDAKNTKLSGKKNDLYEDLDIYDTGITPPLPAQNESETPTTEIPPSETPTPGEASSGSNGRAIKAHASGNDVIYTYSNESNMRRSNGTRAWRNNNPGNIRPGRFTNSVGSIGQAGRFAVFPDEQTGMDAIVKLLKTSSYQKKTLAGAISAWAPPSDGNNTSRYQQYVSQATGISLNTPMRNLNDEQLHKIANEIRRHEGWKPGTESRE